MKHSAEELLLAIHVRELAKEKRNSKLAEALATWDKENPEPKDAPLVGYTDEEIRQVKLAEQQREDRLQQKEVFKINWLHKNSIATFYLEALAELEAVADILKNR